MSDPEASSSRPRVVASVLVATILVVAVYLFLHYRDSSPRGEALGAALQVLIEKQGTDLSLVARTILENYKETRANTERWSGIYWGITFLAATLSALAGVILKFEIILRSEPLKKDLAALFSVAAAVLITISTGGDFHRKWQANRIAAADLERAGYELLAKADNDSRASFEEIARILHTRHVAITGGTDQRTQPAQSDESGSPKQK